MLSKEDRSLLQNNQTQFEREFYDDLPDRSLKIQIKNQMQMNFTTIKFYCELSYSTNIEIISLQDKNVIFVIDCIISLVKQKPL